MNHLATRCTSQSAGIGSWALLLLVGVTLTAACASQPRAENPLQYTENAKRAYDEALEAFLDADWELSDELMREVKRKYGYSRYARLAELRLADAAYRQEKFAEAITQYQTFIHDYPNDPEVPYARYKVASAQYGQSGAGFLLPPLEERDLVSVRDAYASLRGFLDDFPNYAKHRELEFMFEMTAGLLARHELYVARFYLNQDNFNPVVARIHYALTHFKNSGLEAEALVLLGETYLKQKDRPKARAAFSAVLQQYPDSPFSLPARQFLDRMGPEVQ